MVASTNVAAVMVEKSGYIWNIFCSRTNKSYFLVGWDWVVVLTGQTEYSRMTRVCFGIFFFGPERLVDHGAIYRDENDLGRNQFGKNIKNSALEMLSLRHLLPTSVEFLSRHQIYTQGSSGLEIQIWEMDFCKSLASFSDVRGGQRG